jgi:hypothetical protein
MIIPAKFGLNTTNVLEEDVICNFTIHIIGKNKPRPLAAMFFYESGQKCQFGKQVTQQPFL